MATATLHPLRDGFGIELRRGTFHVLVDGSEVASIEAKQTIEAPITPGHHTLQLKAGRYASQERSFDATTSRRPHRGGPASKDICLDSGSP